LTEKQSITDIIRLKIAKETIDEQEKLINILEKENEQLKVDKQYLYQSMSREKVWYKQFKDKVFDLIDEKIREYSSLEQRERTSSDTIEILKELKKELSE